MKIKIDNFEIFKLKQAGLSNQQVLKVLHLDRTHLEANDAPRYNLEGSYST